MGPHLGNVSRQAGGAAYPFHPPRLDILAILSPPPMQGYNSRPSHLALDP